MSSNTRVTARWIAGPDAGGTALLRHGRQFVGRDRRATVRCDDTALLSRHAVLHVTDAGVVASPWCDDGAVLVDGRRVVQPTAVPPGARIEVGRSSLRIEHAVLARDPTAASLGPLGSLAPGTVAATTASVAAIRLHLPTLGTAAAIGLTITFASWAVQALMQRRSGGLTIGVTMRARRQIDLAPRRLRIALTGPHALAAARSVVLQLLEHDPGRRITIVTSVAHPWDWCARFAGVELRVADRSARPARAASTLVTTNAATATWQRRGRRPRQMRIVGVGERAAFRRAAAIGTPPAKGAGRRRRSEIVVR
ncbi:MAG TPA: serine/threonine-protein kinase [Ilumatobacteraceae bacterium]|nr:serine/threonine-protein kinase [Ilumatobacteraceae bacterium]